MAQPDAGRRRPLPPLSRLPAVLWGSLGVGGRVGLGVGLLVVVVAAAVWVPRGLQTTRDNQASDRRTADAQRATEVRRIERMQRPRATKVSPAPPARLEAALSAAILADSRARPGATRARRVSCTGEPGHSGPTRRFACTAVTSDVANANDSGRGVIGYPYRAVVNGPAGRLTWCRVAGRPGEGSLLPRGATPVPRACGG